MPEAFALARALELGAIVSYHEDVVSALKLYFSPGNPAFVKRFALKSQEEVDRELALRLEESEVRSTFTILTSLEASFRIDFELRCKKRLKDDLSRYFRNVKKRKAMVRLDEDILEGWKRYTSAPARVISDLRGAFHFRHWVAHGRYWTPKPGRRYDLDYVRLTAETVSASFGFPG
jgi:hypothetical protein